LKGEDVSIVKMDATANDVPPQFDVRGFPTLYWVNKNNKDNPVRYEVSYLSFDTREPLVLELTSRFVFFREAVI
jgi:hypothetical protein